MTRDVIRVHLVDIIACLIAGIMQICTFIIINDLFVSAYCSILIVSMLIFFVFGKSSLLSPLCIFYLMYLFFIALGPIGFYLQKGEYKESDCVLVILSFLFFLSGYLLSSRINRVRPISRFLEVDRGKEKSLEVLCVCILIIALISEITYFQKNYGLLSLNSLNDSRITALSGNGILIYIGNMWMIASLLLIELCIKGYRVCPYIWIIVASCFVVQLTSGFRTTTAIYLLSIILMINKKKRISTKTVILAGTIIVLFISLYGSFRNGQLLIGSTKSILYDLFIKESYIGLINYKYLNNTFPARHPYFYGKGYLINFLMMRPGPDLDFTLTLKQIVGLTYSGGGLTPTILGELYVNFGYYSVYIGMMIFGVVYGRLSCYLNQTNSYYFPVMILVNCLVAIRTGIANQEIGLVLNTIVYISLCYIANRGNIRVKN